MFSPIFTWITTRRFVFWDCSVDLMKPRWGWMNRACGETSGDGRRSGDAPIFRTDLPLILLLGSNVGAYHLPQLRGRSGSSDFQYSSRVDFKNLGLTHVLVIQRVFTHDASVIHPPPPRLHYQTLQSTKHTILLVSSKLKIGETSTVINIRYGQLMIDLTNLGYTLKPHWRMCRIQSLQYE